MNSERIFFSFYTIYSSTYHLLQADENPILRNALMATNSIDNVEDAAARSDVLPHSQDSNAAAMEEVVSVGCLVCFSFRHVFNTNIAP